MRQAALLERVWFEPSNSVGISVAVPADDEPDVCVMRRRICSGDMAGRSWSDRLGALSSSLMSSIALTMVSSTGVNPAGTCGGATGSVVGVISASSTEVTPVADAVWTGAGRGITRARRALARILRHDGWRRGYGGRLRRRRVRPRRAGTRSRRVVDQSHGRGGVARDLGGGVGRGCRVVGRRGVRRGRLQLDGRRR